MVVASAARIVFVMAASEAEASTIARTLVEERLAACVNLIAPVRSIYRWRGAIEESSECLLLIKTGTRHYAKLERRIMQMHSYKVPEIVAVPLVQGSRDYLKWIADSTKPQTAPRPKPKSRARTARSPRSA